MKDILSFRTRLRAALSLFPLLVALTVAAPSARAASSNGGTTSGSRLGFDVTVQACLVYRDPPGGAYYTAVPKADVNVAAGYGSDVQFCGLYWEIFSGAQQHAHGQASCTYNAQHGVEEVSGWTISRLQDVSASTTYLRARLLVIFDGQRYWTWARYSP